MGMIGNSLAQGLISGANIQDGTVDTPDIKDSAVTAAKIASAVVTPAKMDFSAGTANGVLYLNGSKVASSGSALVFDGANLGVGATPSASWANTWKGIQLKSTPNFIAGGTDLNLISNAYFDGTNYKYLDAFAYASRYYQYNGQHQWFTTTSTQGAGNTLSFTQAMTLSASGYLAIGDQTSPATRVDIRGTSANVASTVQIVGTGVSTLLLGQNADGGVVRGQGGNNCLTLWTGGAGDTAASGAGTERVRIDSSGNFLVNTTSSVWSASSRGVVEVNGSSSAIYGMKVGGSAVGYLYHDGTNFSLWQKLNNALQFGTNDVERVRITGGGSVGINTTAPQSLLHVAASTSAGVYTALTLQNTDNSSSGQGSQIVFKNSSYDGVEAAKYGYIRYRAQSNYGEQGQFTIGTNSGYGTNPVDRLIIYANGGVAVTTGTLYARAAGAYSSVTELGFNSPIQVTETDTGTTAGRFIPMISGTSVSSSGYRQHTLFGSYRSSEWGNAVIAVGGNDNYPTRVFYFHHNGDFTAGGTIYGASKSFKIPHPLPELEETRDLVHISVEAPRADLIYRGKVVLVNGTAQVNIDTASNMTEGTFVALCREVQCFTSNESGWSSVRGVVSGNILSIECQDAAAADTISWMVVGERQDKHMMETDGTDENGNLIVEPLKEPQEIPEGEE